MFRNSVKEKIVSSIVIIFVNLLQNIHFNSEYLNLYFYNQFAFASNTKRQDGKAQAGDIFFKSWNAIL